MTSLSTRLHSHRTILLRNQIYWRQYKCFLISAEVRIFRSRFKLGVIIKARIYEVAKACNNIKVNDYVAETLLITRKLKIKKLLDS